MKGKTKVPSRRGHLVFWGIRILWLKYEHSVIVSNYLKSDFVVELPYFGIQYNDIFVF